MISEKNNLKFKLKTQELISVWQNFCEAHTKLYDMTCNEYVHLLDSDIEALELAIEQKAQLLDTISKQDHTREELLDELSTLTNQRYDHLKDLIKDMKLNNHSNEAKQLENYNSLLLDIVNKIQDQNKTNQLFLNKAIHSLQDLKQSFSGKKNYKTYGANGATKANTTP